MGCACARWWPLRHPAAFWGAVAAMVLLFGAAFCYLVSLWRERPPMFALRRAFGYCGGNQDLGSPRRRLRRPFQASCLGLGRSFQDSGQFYHGVQHFEQRLGRPRSKVCQGFGNPWKPLEALGHA